MQCGICRSGIPNDDHDGLCPICFYDQMGCYPCEDINPLCDISGSYDYIHEAIDQCISSVDKTEIGLLYEWSQTLDDSKISQIFKNAIKTSFDDHYNDVFTALEECEKELREQNARID